MPNTKNRQASDLRTTRDLMNQSARPDLMPSTAAAFRFGALSLGCELLADTLHPLSHRQWAALGTLLGVRPTTAEIAAMLAEGDRP